MLLLVYSVEDLVILLLEILLDSSLFTLTCTFDE